MGERLREPQLKSKENTNLALITKPKSRKVIRLYQRQEWRLLLSWEALTLQQEWAVFL